MLGGDSEVADGRDFTEEPYGILAELLLGLDLVGSTLVRVVIITRAVHLVVHPGNANKAGLRPRLEWFGLSTAVVIVCAAICLVIPNAQTLGRINGAIAILVCILMPLIFYIYARIKGRRRRRQVRGTRFELYFVGFLIACSVVALVFYVVIMVFQRSMFSCVFEYQYSLMHLFVEPRPDNYSMRTDLTLHPIGLDEFCDVEGWNLSHIYLF